MNWKSLKKKSLLKNLLTSLFEKVVSLILNAAPFVAIGAYLAVQWARQKNAKLDQRIKELEGQKREAENAKAIDEKFAGSSDSDIIDHAINRGSKMHE